MIRTIAILAVPGVQLLDVSGPLDVFAEANRLLHREVYEMKVITLEQCNVRASSGVEIVGHLSLAEAVTFSTDTFLVAGTLDASLQTLREDELLKMKAICEKSRRYGSICTGAFLLAQVGILGHRRVTTHWSSADLLGTMYPDIHVDKDALYVVDGPVRTAAGVTSGMDLALRLVEEDLGRELAQDIASHLVMFFRRPANQNHYICRAALSLTGRGAFQELQRWTLTNLDSVRTLRDMAEHMGLSIRHLNRLFQQELEVRPGEWLEAGRINRAKELMHDSRLPLKSIAAEVGYSGTDILRRAFLRRMGVTPALYRKMHGEDDS